MSDWVPPEGYGDFSRRLEEPGTTTLVAHPGMGKTSLVHAVAERFRSRVHYFRSGWEQMRNPFDMLDNEVGEGSLVVIDGLDEGSFLDLSTLERIGFTVQSKSAHLLTTSRVEHIRKVLAGQTPKRNQWDFPGVIYVMRPDAAGRVLVEKRYEIRTVPTYPWDREEFLVDFTLAVGPGEGERPPTLAIVEGDEGLLHVAQTVRLGDALVTFEDAHAWVRPRVLYSRTGGLGLAAAGDLEELINRPDVKERDLQEFFETYPGVLASPGYQRVVPHPILEREGTGPLIPDFALEPIGRGWADLLDLKMPSAKLIVGKKDRLAVSAHVKDAIAQMREYRAYFDERENRERFAKRYGLNAYLPKLLVVIGRDWEHGDSDPLQLRRVWDRYRADADIITYNDLLQRLRYSQRN